MNHYKFVVVGRGIMGSAAAMHLSAASDGVALLGPTESMADDSVDVPKASHYDVGRVTRIADPDPFWSGVAKRSIGRYRALEEATGRKIFNETGFIWAGSNAQIATETFETTRQTGGKISKLDRSEQEQLFPYFTFDPDMTILYQDGDSGTIDPRSYVAAMAERAVQQGTDPINGYAVNVETTGDRVSIVLENGDVVTADRAMIATGAYAAFDGLSPVRIPLKTNKYTLVLIDVPEAIAKGKLAGMPSLISKPSGDRIGTYILPPLQYPDGNFYLKIGIEGPRPSLGNIDELNGWFRTGDDPKLNHRLIQELHELMPSLDTNHWKSLACVTTNTPDRRPVIGLVEDGKICLQLGGNGYSAKSGDALGELGASLLLEQEWTSPIPAAALAPDRFRSNEPI
jgi:sarcosine oxidase